MAENTIGVALQAQVLDDVMSKYGGEDWTARKGEENEWMEEWEAGLTAPSNYLCLQRDL